MIYIGIDNGVTGSIGIIYPDGKSAFIPTPVFKDINYTKKVRHLHRIDISNLILNLPKPNESFILFERPMVNSRAFVATESALRALEATLIALELLGYKRGETYDYIDSKIWQREFISSAIIGSDELKEASKVIGIELFPNHASIINKHKDADGLLIAEFGRRKCQK